MNIKRAAYDIVVRKLESELATVQSKVARNKWNFKVLAEEQSKLKRERGILSNLLWELNKQAKKVKDGN